MTGATPEAVTALLEGLGADAFGMNCGLGPKQMKPIFERLAKSASIPLIINPNAGLPRSENGKTVFDVDPVCRGYEDICRGRRMAYGRLLRNNAGAH